MRAEGGVHEKHEAAQVDGNEVIHHHDSLTTAMSGSFSTWNNLNRN